MFHVLKCLQLLLQTKVSWYEDERIGTGKIF
jgi:hypothetical protein